jgi:hypothetical protein
MAEFSRRHVAIKLSTVSSSEQVFTSRASAEKEAAAKRATEAQILEDAGPEFGGLLRL